jgi:hypothetical protein
MPDEWSHARSKIRVIKFGPSQFETQSRLKVNTFSDLVAVHAFEKLEAWGIKLAIEEGAVKVWDCTGLKAAQHTENHLRIAESVHARIDYVAMDEPLKSGRKVCGLSIEETAQRTAGYISTVTKNSSSDGRPSATEFGDIEPYPQFDIPTLIAWVKALKSNGVDLAFMHIDVNVHLLDVHPDAKNRLLPDLHELSVFLHSEKIPFGVIIWSGYDPLSTDKEYFEHAVAFADELRLSTKYVDQLIFQSWVTRSSKSCGLEGSPKCSPSVAPCTNEDPPYCSLKSIPLNLPEAGNNVFSQTRLVDELLFRVLGK